MLTIDTFILLSENVKEPIALANSLIELRKAKLYTDDNIKLIVDVLNDSDLLYLALQWLNMYEIFTQENFQFIIKHAKDATDVCQVIRYLTNAGILTEDNISLFEKNMNNIDTIKNYTIKLERFGILTDNSFKLLMNHLQSAEYLVQVMVLLNSDRFSTCFSEKIQHAISGTELSRMDLIAIKLDILFNAGRLNDENLLSAMKSSEGEFSLKPFDLRGIDFHGVNLCGENLSDKDLSGANLIGTDLNRVDLRKANLTKVKIINPSALNNPDELKKSLDSLDRFEMDKESILVLRKAVLMQLLMEVKNKEALEAARDHAYFSRHRDHSKEGDGAIEMIAKKARMFLTRPAPTSSQAMLQDKIDQLGLAEMAKPKRY